LFPFASGCGGPPGKTPKTAGACQNASATYETPILGFPAKKAGDDVQS